MKKIAICNSKGGVAKTTTAIYFASELAAHGKTLLWDADHQGSATMWAQQAEEAGDPLPFEVRPVNLALLKAAPPKDVDWIVIDTPPGSPDTIQAAINTADVVVIPTDSRGMALARVGAMLDVIPPGIPHCVLITMSNTATIAYRETVDTLTAADVAMFSAPIPRREEIGRSYGSNPKTPNAYTGTVNELMEAMK
ncbi:ParA family protein [Dermabacteraceae bacterium P13115]